MQYGANASPMEWTLINGQLQRRSGVMTEGSTNPYDFSNNYWEGFWNGGRWKNIGGSLLFGGPEKLGEVKAVMPEWLTPGGSAFKAAKGFRHALSLGKEGQSIVARALQKHPNIARLVGNSANFTTNAARHSIGVEALKYIMRNGTKTTKAHRTFGTVVDFKLANGLGARFNAVTNEFIGFLGRGL